MAAIKITDLNPVGSSFFSDSESYLNELTAEETLVMGGITPTTIPISLSVVTISLSTVSATMTPRVRRR